MLHQARFRRQGLTIAAAILTFLAAAPAQQQFGSKQNEPAARVLTVEAGSGERGVFTPRSLEEYPQKMVTLIDPGTRRRETFAGVPLMELLAHLGVPHGKDLKGKALAAQVIAAGADGSRSMLTLREISASPDAVLVADGMDGKPLDETNGPFQLVVSRNHRLERSVRRLVRIEVKKAE